MTSLSEFESKSTGMSDPVWVTKADSRVELPDALDQHGWAASPLSRSRKAHRHRKEDISWHWEDKHKDGEEVTQSSDIREYVVGTAS